MGTLTGSTDARDLDMTKEDLEATEAQLVGMSLERTKHVGTRPTRLTRRSSSRPERSTNTTKTFPTRYWKTSIGSWTIPMSSPIQTSTPSSFER